MIRAAYAWWLAYLNAIEETELRDRCIDGSASTAWAVMVRDQIDTRTQRINELRRPRLALMKARA